MTASFWQNVQVAMESALGSPITATGITNANPGVVSASSHGLSNGAYVKATASGMYQLDGRIARVANGNVGDFELENIDTTLFGVHSTASFEEITFGITLTSLTNVSSSGGEAVFADTTTIHDANEQQVPVRNSARTMQFDALWDPSEAGQLALQQASQAIIEKAFLFTFSNGKKVVFNGYVGASGAPTGSAGEVVTTPVTITINSDLTNYAT